MAKEERRRPEGVDSGSGVVRTVDGYGGSVVWMVVRRG